MFELCEYEDSTNCIWDAQVQGNGIGESFIDIEGIAYYEGDTLPSGETFTEAMVQINNEPIELANTGFGEVGILLAITVGIAMVMGGITLMRSGRTYG